jgi:ABC-2 type transport system permease protein
MSATTTQRPRTAPGGFRASGERPARPSVARLSLMVAEREITTQVRTKSFIVSTAILFAAVLVSILLGAVLGGNDDPTRVAVVGPAAEAVADAEALDLEPVDAADRAAAERLVRDGEVSAAIVPDDASPIGIKVIALDDTPEMLVAGLSVSPEVELLDPSNADEGLRWLVAFGFGLVFLMSAAGYGATIAQSTVQEKQSRVVEILLSTVPAKALLAGKILGNSVLAFGQTAGLAAMAVIGLMATGQEHVLDMLSSPLVWFVGFFLVGFVLLASMYAASAALVSRVEDTGSVLMPATMLTMIPYFGVIFFNDNELVLNILSYVPFSAPVAMPMRLFLGEAQWFEPLVALVILVLTTVGMILVGAKIYERSLLRTGARVKLTEVLRQS